MASQELLCLCGHSWERSDPGPIPTNIREICPVCTPGIRSSSQPTVVAPETVPTQLNPGDRLAGFEIIKPLNRGGMGVVYKARQSGLNRLVALKVIAPERLSCSDQEEYLVRFRREARAAALLNHPNIVTVYDTDLSGRQPYFAMEYVEGIDLYRLVQRNGPLGILESCEYVRQVALGLQHAFERGLTHRDIKPHNLMVTPSPLAFAPEDRTGHPFLVKILDMGLARVESADEGLEQGLTCAEVFLGTPDYAAPEQAEDSRLADIRADLYSLGATWFYLLTGEVPFPGISLMQKLRRQLTQPTPLVSEHRQEIPAVLVAFVRRLMDRDPAQRFQTPAELAAAISAFMSDPTRLPDWMSPSESSDPLLVEAHSGAIAALCLNSDGRLLLAGGDDEMLRSWSLPELEPVRTLSGDPGPVCGIAMTGSGKWGASCALRLMPQDMVVQLWDLTTGVEKRRLRGARDSLVCVALTSDGRKVAAGCRDGTVHLWTLDPAGVSPLNIVGHVGAVTAIAFAGDGSQIVSGGMDGRIRISDVMTGEVEEIASNHGGTVHALTCAQATDCLAVAGNSLLLRHLDGRVVVLDGHPGGTLSVAFARDGTLLASGGSDQMVRVWRTADGVEVAAFQGHEGPVRAVAISPDRRFVYSGGADGTLRRWSVPAQNVSGTSAFGIPTGLAT